MYEREALEVIQNINKTFKVLLVTDPRQVGKTTLLLSIKPDNMKYVTLDDEVLRKQAKDLQLSSNAGRYLKIYFISEIVKSYMLEALDLTYLIIAIKIKMRLI